MALTVNQRWIEQGRYESNSLLLNTDANGALLVFDMSASDLADVDLTIRHQVDWSQDDGVTWQVLFGPGEWRGGQLSPRGTFDPPSARLTRAIPAGTRIRIAAEVSKRVRVGMTADIF